jgi:excinuclease ABC subunit A
VPDVDAIDGLPPAVALQQQRGSSNARSSVGSVTTLSSLVRMMYSRAGAYPANQPMLYAEDFSPNTPQGACPTCHGLGHVYEVTEAIMVPDPSLSIRERAIASWPPPGKARTCATSWSAWATTLTDRGRTCRRRIATGFCSPRKHRRCRCTPASRPPRPAPRSSARWSRATWAPSPAPGGMCCTPLPTPRAR